MYQDKKEKATPPPAATKDEPLKKGAAMGKELAGKSHDEQEASLKPGGAADKKTLPGAGELDQPSIIGDSKGGKGGSAEKR